jgi:hypothetical protein
MAGEIDGWLDGRLYSMKFRRGYVRIYGEINNLMVSTNVLPGTKLP